MPVKPGFLSGIVILGVALCGAGCSSSKSTDQQAAATSGKNGNNSGDENFIPPTISISPDDDDGEMEDDADDNGKLAEPEKGTPEWHIREIVRLRLKPYPVTAEAAGGEQPGKKPAKTTESAEDLEQQSKARRDRNLEVVKLASQAIALTHKDSEKEVTFNAAVHHLLDARLQLALAGEQEDVEALYEIAEALQNSRPNSDAAATAALTIVNFAHANAMRYAQTEPRWIQEFSRQAQLFAARISDGLAAVTEDPSDALRKSQLQKDASRAAQILLAAGQSCEAAAFPEDARTCYSLLKAKFPDSLPAQQAIGIIRRMQLKGQPLQLAGPTLDGSFLSIEDFQGKTVLVVFWSSQAKPFLDHLPALTELLKKAQKHVSVIGVCLDTDESELDGFLAEQNLNWPQIFFSEPEKRGWNSPLAGYYGITSLPTLWIVDPSGVVAETDVTASDVEAKLKDVVRKSLSTTKTGSTGKIQPVGRVTSDK